MWREYEVAVRFTGRLMGGTPSDPKAIIGKLEAEGRGDLAAEVAAEVGVDMEAPPEKEVVSRLVFKRNEGGLYVEGYTWKAHLKDAAKVLATVMKSVAGGKEKVANFRAKVADRVYVVEDHIPILRESGASVTEPDDEFVHPVQVMTPKGPRSSVKVNDVVVGAAMAFTLRVLDDRVISEEMIRDLFAYGSMHGYGAERGLQQGRYEFRLEAKDT